MESYTLVSLHVIGAARTMVETSHVVHDHYWIAVGNKSKSAAAQGPCTLTDRVYSFKFLALARPPHVHLVCILYVPLTIEHL